MSSETLDASIDQRAGWERLLSEILRRREQYDQNGSPRSNGAERAFIARVRRGASPQTEAMAYGDVLPYCDPEQNGRDHAAILRAMAIAAEFSSISQAAAEKRRKSFGAYCYQVSRAKAGSSKGIFSLDPARPDAVASRLNSMLNLSFEQAVLTVRQILQLGRKEAVSLDYFDLTRMFLYWGNGYSEESRRFRRKLLRDYYGAFNSEAEESPSESESENATKDN